MTEIDEREQLARIDLALAEAAREREQLRQMKAFPAGTFEGWKVAFAGLTAGGALFGAGAALMAVILHLGGHG